MTAPTRHTSRERGFSIVEVVIAMVLIAVVVAGATAMFGGSTRSTTNSSLTSLQTQIAEETINMLEADPTWATWCRTQPNPNDCNVSQWMNSPANAARYQDIGKVRLPGSTALEQAFNVEARAVGVDLKADGVGPNDEDGIRPDVYRLAVTVVPVANTRQRFPQLKPKTVNADMNPSIRVQSGRLTVDVCMVTNQVDERVAAGDCSGGASATPMAPPPTFVSSNPAGSCDAPTESTGSLGRDCIAFKCANPQLAGMTGIAGLCNDFPAWSNPGTWGGDLQTMTKVQIKPASGTVQLRNPSTGAVVQTRPLVNGRVLFNDLRVGRYRVVVSGVGSGSLWRSKSVPSTDLVAVEAGLNSRAVLMYRPPANASLNIPITSIDGTYPWNRKELDGWVGLTENGAIVENNTPIRVCLVPVPQGRLHKDDIPCVEVPRNSSTTSFPFTNIEPGLYSAQLTIGYESFMNISGTGGFLYVKPGGVVTGTTPTPTELEYINGLCAKNLRETIVGTTVNPITGEPLGGPVQSCASGGGPSGPGGGGGGGGQ